MYWTNEYNMDDKEIRHLYKEYAAAVGIFTGVVVLAMIAGLFV